MIRAALGAVSLLWAGGASAASLDDCARIADDAQRLECFDQLSRKAELGNNPEAALNGLPNTPTPADQAVPAPGPGADSAFGSEMLSGVKSSSPDKLPSMDAHIVGHFEQWHRGMRVTLDNGQVWECTQAPRLYRALDNPEIRISRNFLGHYSATVGGSGPVAQVRRVL